MVVREQVIVHNGHAAVAGEPRLHERNSTVITPTRTIIGVLSAAVIGLGIALGVALADDDEPDGHMMDDGQGFAGMMSAMASLDSDAMLAHMKEVLGEDGFNRMQDHFRGGTPMAGMTEIDEMMHKMMDGMMAEMTADSNDILPPSDAHHETPTATSR